MSTKVKNQIDLEIISQSDLIFLTNKGKFLSILEESPNERIFTSQEIEYIGKLNYAIVNENDIDWIDGVFVDVPVLASIFFKDFEFYDSRTPFYTILAKKEVIKDLYDLQILSK
jgi:hypothetical protein